MQAAGHTGVLYPELIAPWEVQLLRAIVPWLLHLPVIKEIIRIPTDKKKMALDSTYDLIAQSQRGKLQM